MLQVSITTGSSQVRQNVSISMQTTLPGSSVVAGSYLYVDFPQDFASNLVRGLSVSCSLTAVGTTTNFASSCTMLSHLRLALLILTTDSSNNLPKTYNLVVNSFPLPANVPPLVRNYMRFYVFVATSD
jgi:hypothetical protein